MDLRLKKKINVFAVVVVMMILVPEVVAHFYFDTQKHPVTSSVDTALSLTNRQHGMYTNDTLKCHLVLENDTNVSNVSRANGLQGQYGVYSCT